MEAIAARAGVGKQTIYRWWPDKGAVVLDAYLVLIRAGEGVTFPQSDDLEADPRTVLRSTVGSCRSGLRAAIQGAPELAAALREELLRPWLEATKGRLRAARRTGQIGGDVDLDVAADMLCGPVYYRWLLRTGPVSREHADAIASGRRGFLLTGLPGLLGDQSSSTASSSAASSEKDPPACPVGPRSLLPSSCGDPRGLVGTRAEASSPPRSTAVALPPSAPRATLPGDPSRLVHAAPPAG